MAKKKPQASQGDNMPEKPTAPASQPTEMVPAQNQPVPPAGGAMVPRAPIPTDGELLNAELIEHDGKLHPPSVLALTNRLIKPLDPIAAAFAEEAALNPEAARMLNQQFELKTNAIPLIEIDHDNACFTIGDSIQLPEIEGFPIASFQTRKFWDTPYNKKNTLPPVCASLDLVVPVPTASKPQAKDCATCPMSKFGSAQQGAGEGQACRVLTTIFILNPKLSSEGVSVLVVPPTSIRAWQGTQFNRGYLDTAKLFPGPSGNPIERSFLVWTKFELDQEEGDKYCTLKPSPVTTVQTANEARALMRLMADCLPSMNAFKQMQALTGSGRDS